MDYGKNTQERLQEATETDEYIAFLLIRGLLTPFDKSEAFKMGLIDADGRIIREPVLASEKEALSLFNRICILLRQTLKSRIAVLKDFQAIYSDDLDPSKFDGKLSVVGKPHPVSQMRRVSEKLNDKLKA